VDTFLAVGVLPHAPYDKGAAPLKGLRSGVESGCLAVVVDNVRGSFSLRSWVLDQNVDNEKEPGGSIRSGNLAGRVCRIS
jgi:hypothetical protein